jgi:thiol:disulfide interchange protein DsbC
VNMIARLVVLVLLLVPAVPLSVQADEDVAAVRKRLEQRFTDLTITDLRAAPIPGLYELTFGSRIVLVTGDGRYLIQGDLIDLESRRNLTQEQHSKLILKSIEAIGEKNMVVMGPANAKRTITVFTDVDCPYCARLHKEVPKLNKAGVKVRYLLYPRAGKGSETYKKSVSVWCAKDRIKALGAAKSGGKIEPRTCANPVDEHLKLGAEVGVEGTPTLVFDDGRIVPGFAPADKLLAALGLANGEKTAAPQ